MAKKASAETPDFVEIGGIRWPVLNAETMAAVCGFSTDYLRQLERAGRFKKRGRDRYIAPEVFAGYIAHLKDEERRSTKSAEARRVLEARAREIEIRTAQRTGDLIDMDTICEHIAMILGAFRIRACQRSRCRNTRPRHASTDRSARLRTRSRDARRLREGVREVGRLRREAGR